MEFNVLLKFFFDTYCFQYRDLWKGRKCSSFQIHLKLFTYGSNAVENQKLKTNIIFYIVDMNCSPYVPLDTFYLLLFIEHIDFWTWLAIGKLRSTNITCTEQIFFYAIDAVYKLVLTVDHFKQWTHFWKHCCSTSWEATFHHFCTFSFHLSLYNFISAIDR